MTEYDLMKEVAALVTTLLDSRGCQRDTGSSFEDMHFVIHADDALDLPTTYSFLRDDWRELGDFSGEITIREVTRKRIEAAAMTTFGPFIRFPFRVTEGRVVVPGRYATRGHRFSRKRLRHYAEWASRAAASWEPEAKDRRLYEHIVAHGVADDYAHEKSLRVMSEGLLAQAL